MKLYVLVSLALAFPPVLSFGNGSAILFLAIGHSAPPRPCGGVVRKAAYTNSGFEKYKKFHIMKNKENRRKGARMKKGLFLLAFLAFTFNVKAETIDFGNITAIDGTTPQEWLTNYVITGGEIRVAWASLPTDSLGGFYYYSVRYDNGMTNAWLQGNFSNTGYSLRGLFRAFYVAFEHYQELGYFSSEDIPALWPTSLFTEDTTFTISSMANSINTLQDGTGISSTTGKPSKMAVEREAAARNQSMLLEKVAPYQSIPINGLKIDVASGGSCTNCEVLLGSILTNMITYTDYLLYMATNQTDNANVAYNLNHHDWTVDDKWEVITNLYSQQGLGNVAVQFDYFQRLELLLAALVYKPQNDYSDYLSTITNQLEGIENYNYTDWMNLVLTTNITPIVAFYNDLIGTKNGNKTLTIGELRQLLGGSSYYTAWSQASQNLRNNASFHTESSMLGMLYYLERYQNMENELIEYRKYGQLTNIIDGIDLGRDWLNLATNDISSLPYWLNQQATGGNLLPGQTNSLNDSEFRFNLLTNQYAQISLTGSNPSNSGENWNYFKRLEMLLAAIVYKQTDLSKIGEADDDNGTELSNDTSVSSAVSAAEQDVSTSLSTVASSLSLTGLESSKNNLVSLWQIAVGAFDTPGSKPQITIFEQDEVGGDNNSSGAVNLDFSQGSIGDFCDFCHHLFGFLWSFGSLFIFWKVAKYCWDMGYRVVRFHYSLCRKFLGI